MRAPHAYSEGGKMNEVHDTLTALRTCGLLTHVERLDLEHFMTRVDSEKGRPQQARPLDAPGVYVFSGLGRTLYVGASRRLGFRLRQHFAVLVCETPPPRFGCYGARVIHWLERAPDLLALNPLARVEAIEVHVGLTPEPSADGRWYGALVARLRAEAILIDRLAPVAHLGGTDNPFLTCGLDVPVPRPRYLGDGAYEFEGWPQGTVDPHADRHYERKPGALFGKFAMERFRSKDAAKLVLELAAAVEQRQAAVGQKGGNGRG